MKFAVDCMLGKLAKWLKILGFDVVYNNKAEDSELLNIARRQGRILLTRDVLLFGRAKEGRCLLIESEKWQEQIEQVLRDLDLRFQARPYSRCLHCNVELKTLAKGKAKNLVAPFVFERAASFAVCPECGRVFWQGTHFKDMESKLAGILGKKSRPRKVRNGRPSKPAKKRINE